MKLRMSLIATLLMLGAGFTQCAFAEQWDCWEGAFLRDSNNPDVFPTFSPSNPTTTIATIVSITGPDSESRTYNWIYKFRNNDPGASCQELSRGGPVTNTTGLAKQQTWLRTNYAWGSTYVECTTTGHWGASVAKGLDWCSTSFDTCFR